MKELFEFLHFGANINYFDGVILGVISLLYFILVSFVSSQTICERLKEKLLDKSLFIFFIITFISYIVKNKFFISFIYEKYPLFLSYYKLLRYLEIFIFIIFIGILIYIAIVWISLIISIQAVVIMFFLLIIYMILNYLVIDVFKIKYFIDFDTFLIISFVSILVYFIRTLIDTIKFKIISFSKNFYRNLTCFLRLKNEK